MKLIEVFNTYQGEGPDSGRQMTLIRFRKCDRVENRRPCPWCDTLIKMRISAEAEYSDSTIVEMLSRTRGLMITGGEPGFAPNLKDLEKLLLMKEYDVANIETNGCNITDIVKIIVENDLQDKVKIIYSPKFFRPEEVEDAIENTRTIINLPFVYIKVVDDRMMYVRDYLHEVCKMEPSKNKIWIMPEGDTKDKSIANSGPTFDLIEEYGLNFSSRNHIIFGFI